MERSSQTPSSIRRRVSWTHMSPSGQKEAASSPPAKLSKTTAQQGDGAPSGQTDPHLEGSVNRAYRQDAEPDRGEPDRGECGAAGGPGGAATHSLVLDLSAASFVDTVAVKTLKNVNVPHILDRQMWKWGHPNRHEVGLDVSCSTRMCTSVTMEMSIRKQVTQQTAATTSRRTAPGPSRGGSMSMRPVMRPSRPTN
ncbi:hypothetical protein EYF80_053481 [Liparis tanakae]|uniref:Uncharacterized protein n=1 Tax=Liparis tanakae TaxID=230148 RepID=A0A4Z2F683_9TELE|nr:hypothetical protein EYF80_053481 [Liparis tanakae]